MIAKIFSTCCLLLNGGILFGQQLLEPQIISPEKIMQSIANYHPIVLQSKNNVTIADAQRTISQGAFDPVFTVSNGNKKLNGTSYYQYTTPQLEIPTWYGIELFAGAENWNGTQVNPANTLGTVNYVGISVPLLKDLVIDKRRAALAKAKVYVALSAIEQQNIINQVNYEALDIYWQWNKAYQKSMMLQKLIANNTTRFSFVKKAYNNGERAAIDTIESLTQLQLITNKQLENWMQFQSLGILLSGYLWQENLQPFNFTDSTKPINFIVNNTLNIDSFALTAAINTATQSHPAVLYYNQKNKLLQIDKKLQFQSLLPKLNVNYNAINKSNNPVTNFIDATLLQNNYQYGVKFEMPLRVSEGRGLYKIAKLQLLENNYLLAQKQNDIRLKITTVWNNNLQLMLQYKLLQENFKNYQTLVQAENTKYLNGESSLFVINSRESSALDAFEKLIDIENKIQKNKIALQFAMGRLQ